MVEASPDIRFFKQLLPRQLELLRQLVLRESFSDDKPAVDRLGRFVERRMARSGAITSCFPQKHAGNHYLGRWGSGGGGLLMLAHLDTVHPQGSLQAMPWRTTKRRAYGPGVLDMKASLAMALTAIEALSHVPQLPQRRVSLLCTSDEETGSHSSRPLIERQARQHELVLCLEPALPDGALKIWRKGIGDFHLTAEGRASHAGANPEDGVNAILEMAAQIEAIMALQDEKRGTTINIGQIQGGTRPNVVPASCWIDIDVRLLDPREGQRIDAGLAALRPKLAGSHLRLRGEWNRPPMPRSPANVAAFERARELAAAIGLELRAGGTGGGSDANFVAALGIPILDGLGAVGGGAHSEREFIELGSLPGRTALLAALLSGW
jgi:glutamate carboxypeptidase